MNVFGLTPMDAAMSVWGLNNAYMLADFIFLRTPVGLLCFIIGVLLSIKPIIQAANFRPFFYVLFIYFTIFVLLLCNKEVGRISSFVENNGQISTSAQQLKDQWSLQRYVPVILAFVEQSSFSLMTGIIHVLDSGLAEPFRFLKFAFTHQINVLSLRQIIIHPLTDVRLSQEMDDFLHSYYLPAVHLVIREHPTMSINDLWPGHELILERYSAAAKNEWNNLFRQIISYTEKRHIFEAKWTEYFAKLTDKAIPDIKRDIVRSVCMQNLNKNMASNLFEWEWLWTLRVISHYPFWSGFFNVIILTAFPMILIYVLLSRRLNVLYAYFKFFLWAKLNILTSACACYVSLIYVQIQKQASVGLYHLWEYPVFCLVAALALVLLPALSGVFIHHIILFKH